MPKMKTKRAVAKRFKLTGSGKIKFKKRGLRHILTKHSSDNKRKKRKVGIISDADHKLIMRGLPHS